MYLATRRNDLGNWEEVARLLQIKVQLGGEEAEMINSDYFLKKPGNEGGREEVVARSDHRTGLIKIEKVLNMLYSKKEMLIGKGWGWRGLGE